MIKMVNLIFMYILLQFLENKLYYNMLYTQSLGDRDVHALEHSWLGEVRMEPRNITLMEGLHSF